MPILLTGIDFETANASRASACSVGLSRIGEDGEAMTCERLLKPHISCRGFEYMNICIHGIRPRDVAASPEFAETAPWLESILCGDGIVAAHNAVFDMSVLKALYSLYSLELPTFRYFCTYKAASRIWPDLENHKLDTLCRYIGHDFSHHNAASDAEAACRVLLAMIRETGVDSVEELSEAAGLTIGLISPDGCIPCAVKRPKKRRRRE